MSTIHVRPATATDADAVAELLAELGYPAARDDVVARLARMQADPNTAVLVATTDTAVVGLATLHVLHVINRPHQVGQLTALVVHSGARQLGVGRALVGAVANACRERGCERLTVTTHIDRIDAPRFYERVGFERTGSRFGMMLMADALPSGGEPPARP